MDIRSFASPEHIAQALIGDISITAGKKHYDRAYLGSHLAEDKRRELEALLLDAPMVGAYAYQAELHRIAAETARDLWKEHRQDCEVGA